MSYLELHGITKRFRGITAVDDLSLNVEEGEMVCLLGPSGCGKTTTLRIIAGFEPTDAGTIRLNGRDMTSALPEKRDIGLVFQNYALFPHLTVHQNVAFGLEMRRRAAREIVPAVEDALRLVQLAGVGRRFPRELSGGQQQRVALARAIAIRPRLLLLDEPLSNLDAKLRDTMRDVIRRVQRETGITAIFVTHDQVEALAMADRMAVMDRGRIVQMDTPDRVYERPAHPFIAGFIGQANLLHGTVIKAIGDDVTMSVSAELAVTGLAEATLIAGQSATAVVKTDRVRLSREAAGEAIMRVRVQSCTFLGPTLSYVCVAGANRIVAALPSAPENRFSIGEELHVSWSNSDCLIIPGEYQRNRSHFDLLI